MEISGIKVLFLDIGGVLLSNGWAYESRKRAAQIFKFDFAEMDALHQCHFNVYEIGSITLNEYLDRVVFNQPREFTRDEFKAFMFAQSSELPDVLPWIREWKKNCGVPIISINNEGRELNDFRIKKFGLHQCFDAFISSCEVGMLKPDPTIFKLAMGIAQVSPEECIYFDDQLMLAEAGQQVGIRSFQHQSFLSTKKILESIKFYR